MEEQEHKAQPSNNNTEHAPDSADNPTPVPSVTATPQTNARPSTVGTNFWVAASAIVAAGLAAGFAEWRNAETRTAIDAQLAEITARDGEGERAAMAALQDRIGRMENLLATGSASRDAAQTQFQNRLTELDQTTDATRTELASALTRISAQLGAESDSRRRTMQLLGEQIASLDARIGILEQSYQQRADTVVAVAGLARAALGSGSFQSELEAFERASGETLSDALRAAAVTGMPGWPELTTRFPEAARKALESGQQPEDGGGLVERTTRYLENLVIVRPAGEVAGSTPEALLSQAQARLQEGDPAAAIAALEHLPPSMHEAMEDWIHAARLRLAAEAEIDALLHATLGQDG